MPVQVLNRSNKDRLYVALYEDNNANNNPHGQQNGSANQRPNNIPQLPRHRYTWGFCTAPKREVAGRVAGRCYRITQATGQWDFENLPLVHVHHGNANGTRLLARVLVGKVINRTSLETILTNATRVQVAGWDYRDWMADVFQRLRANVGQPHLVQVVAVTSLTPADWPHIRAVARRYVRSEIAHGRYNGPFVPAAPIPTFCMLEYKFLVP